MNVNALIDAIVRQTTILIAQLAPLGGGRAQLAHTANQVFLDLSAALREHGVGSKVVADMFGLALRTYQERVRRLSESQSMRGRSLWEAVLPRRVGAGRVTGDAHEREASGAGRSGAPTCSCSGSVARTPSACSV